MNRKLLNVLTVTAVLCFSFAPLVSIRAVDLPQNFNDAEVQGEGILQRILQTSQDVIKNIWSYFLNILKVIWEKIAYYWNKYLAVHFDDLWERIKSFWQWRKPIVEQNYETTKQEIKEEAIPQAKSWWDKLRDLWQ